MHGQRTRVSDGVGNRGSNGEYNNQPLSDIDSGGNAVRGDGGGGGCSGGARVMITTATATQRQRR
jgi:hypothetical protein